MSGIQTFLAFFNARSTRFLARIFGLAAMSLTVLHGASRSGLFDDQSSPWSRLPGKLASFAGMSAEDIRISGLNQHDPQQILAALNVRPGGSLIGFDANSARETLQAMPWVKSASVERAYPNILKIGVIERVAVALWQHGGALDLVDAGGVAMGQPLYLTPRRLPLVTGEGANLAAAELISQLSTIPDLSQKVSAAARVGKRRWTLYLDNGVKVALPEQGVPSALQTVWYLEQKQGLFSKGISTIDVRVPEKLTVEVAVLQEGAGPPSVKTAQKK